MPVERCFLGKNGNADRPHGAAAAIARPVNGAGLGIGRLQRAYPEWSAPSDFCRYVFVPHHAIFRLSDEANGAANVGAATSPVPAGLGCAEPSSIVISSYRTILNTC